MAISGALLGMAYAFAIIVAVSILLYLSKIDRKIVLAVSFVTAALGILIHAPMIPLQMQSLLVNGDVGNGMPWYMATIVIIVLIGSSLVIGRVFCGYACPIGALQELAYTVPTPKFAKNGDRWSTYVHIAMTLLFFALGAIWSFGLLGFLGVRDLFDLKWASASFYIFLGFLAVGIFYYRPFCRLVCPFGLFAGFLSRWSLLKIGKGGGCDSCRRCEGKCPTGAMAGDGIAECFLCLRCGDVCRQEAIVFKKKEASDEGKKD